MYPQTHFLFSFLLGLVLAKLGVFSYKVAFFIAVFAVLMDIDHFINFFLRREDMSLKDAWNSCSVGHFRGRTFIHHRVGFVLLTLIIVLLYFVSKTFFWIIGFGYYSHMFLDYAHLNVLRIRGKIKVKEAGFKAKIGKFEIMLDMFLIIGIVLLWL